ncbi:DNA ligase [Bacillus phage PBS1]|uniref:DNA ligase (NAD(+)) n=1 Tax=Bacillus phage PBS1 TaxID=2884423 RepID=A0A223LDS9_BPPB1|nr:NAD-dependent DNA ligase [Bacillus phage PBS1]ASU00113.1 DNA ligase [Bacillus phage PBS1]BDE75378.1 DNA ligase [Bacillus phage PBS1]
MDKLKIQKFIISLKQKKNLSAEKLEEVKSFLDKASEAYYNTGQEILSDDEFDAIAREFKRLGGKLDVGANPPKGKGTVDVSHTFAELVGTLDKTNFIYEKNVDDPSKKSVEEWLNNIIKKLGNDKEFSLGISFKFDGNSVVIEYKDGKVVRALTRGRNGLGMDLTHVFKDHTIKRKDHVGIKYEIIIPWKRYEDLMKDTGVSYANPRSLVSGKLGDDNAYEYYKYMELVPLWVKPYNSTMERTEQLEFIEEAFGEDNSLFSDYRLIEGVTGNNLTPFMEELEDMYEKYNIERYNLPFMIDGLVIEVLEEDIRNTLGYVNDEPNWATALKFPYMEKTTTVTDFDFTLGDSGIITARVWYEPVTFNGTEHRKQSLQNYKRFKELGLGIGSQILVQYRNDCLSYVVPILNEHNKNISPHPYTDKCPVCGGEVGITKTGAFAYCKNETCEGKTVGKIQNYLTKMDIKGIKESTIVKLHNAGLVKSITDLYTMDYGKIAEVDGLGAIASINISGAINSKIPYDYEIIGALGISSFSTSKAKELCKVFSVQEMLDILESYYPENLINSITQQEGFSDITANYIVEGLQKNKETIEFLLKREHKVFKTEYEKMAGVQAMKIVFTNFRDEAMQIQLEMAGHKITSAVSRKTNIVVTPNPNGNTVKLKKAREYGIRIVSVDEFKEEMGIS